jgi:hypothetical protein
MNAVTRRSLPRVAYRLILRAHPAPFRERFGEEMLWIFDEECSSGAGRLFVDGALSAIRQHSQEQDEIPPRAAGFTVGIPTSAMSFRRFLQGGVVASLIVYGVMVLMARNGVASFPVHAGTHSCSRALYAPSRISSPPKPPQR